MCLALTALAGCSGKTKEMQKVTVCEVTHSICYAPQYVALAKGFVADEGLDVELSNGGGADKVMSAVLSGNVDIGFAGPEASIYVYNEGKAVSYTHLDVYKRQVYKSRFASIMVLSRSLTFSISSSAVINLVRLATLRCSSAFCSNTTMPVSRLTK